MAVTLDVSCPGCEKAYKVPAELAGKKIKCKACGAIVPVPAARGAAKPAAATPAAKKPAAATPEAKPEDAPIAFKKPFAAADDDDDDATPMAVINEGDAPRCPHCAQELDPPTARICRNCGYDMRERRRHEAKTTIALTFGDWATHLAPGIICVLLTIGLLTFDFITFQNQESWFDFMEMEGEKDPFTNKPKYLVNPGMITLWITIFSLWVSTKLLKFAYKRLYLNFRPQEIVKKK